MPLINQTKRINENIGAGAVVGSWPICELWNVWYSTQTFTRSYATAVLCSVYELNVRVQVARMSKGHHRSNAIRPCG